MKIVSKIRVLSLGVVLGATLAASLISYWGYRQSISDLEEDALERQLESEVVRLESSFSEVLHDVQMLAGMPSMERILVGGGNDATDKLELGKIFESMLYSKPYYDQVRLIGKGNEGMELVRVDRLGDRIVVRRDEEMQAKGGRYYYTATRALPEGGVYYSKVDLNREFGEIEVPHRPMLRVGMPLYTAPGVVSGIVIVNLNFARFMESFWVRPDDRVALYMTNADGDFLVHPNMRKTFGFDLGKRFLAQEEFRELANFFEDEGAEMATLRLGYDIEESGLSLVHFRKATLFGDGREFALGVAGEFDEVGAATRSVLTRTLWWTVVFAVVVLTVGLVFGNRISRSIELITGAVVALGKGESDRDLPTEREDEIGILARSFDSMRQALTRHRKRLEESNAALTRANLDLEHFTHISSHELREPLTRIGGMASLLEMEVGVGKFDEATMFASRLCKESRNALQQISDFRIFAQLSHGSPLRAKVDLGKLVTEVQETFRERLIERRMRIESDELPVVEVYRNLVYALYRNLIENALKYGAQEGGIVRLTCEGESPGYVLGVKNTGAAISEDDAQQIFDDYVRLEKNREPGSGLGLGICKRIVERHLGRIWVESGDGVTHFKFTLSERIADGSDPSVL